MSDELPGVWMAYHSDFSGLAVFDDELEAYKYAERNYMRVLPLPFGVDAREAIQNAG